LAKWLEQVMPDEYVSSVYEIDLDKLWEIGKRLLLTDLDNTLVPWNHPDVPAPLLNWIQTATNRGFKVCIVSNNTGPRVQAFAQLSGIHAVGAAKKPKPHGYRQALQQFDVPVTEAVMVGDQLFTDIRGGNLYGLYTILVLPINKKEWWGTKMTRQLEKYAMRRLVKRGLQIPVQIQIKRKGD
jgi:uncharacterized protein